MSAEQNKGNRLSHVLGWFRRGRTGVNIQPDLSSVSVEQRELPFSFESFSAGKTSKKPDLLQRNEDRWVATPHYISVIDGATANPPISLEGHSSGEYAAIVIARLLETAKPGMYGQELVNYISAGFKQALDTLPSEDAARLRDAPYAKPYASFAAASIIDDKVVITQLGDVGFRINGGKVYDNPKEIDDIHTRMRVEAINEARRRNPTLTTEELLEIGKNTILQSLRDQVQNYQNRPDQNLGYGVIDGQPVDPKFVRVYGFDARAINTLEMFSDGYFKVGDQSTIQSWEQAFREVEVEDPYKIGKYPTVKGSTEDIFTDDRTVVIAKFQTSKL